MKPTTYTSKKIGTISIKNDANKYTLCSERLEARSLNQDEEHFLITKYSKLLGNPENVKLFAEGKPWTLKMVEEFICSETQKWTMDNKFSVFSIYHATTKEFIGYLHIKHSLDEFAKIGAGHSNAAEIAYILDKQFWGKGYGTEIAILGKKFIKHIIAESNEKTPEKDIKEVVATVHPENKGSKEILKRTLKHQELEVFTKFEGQPRLLFFKPLKTAYAPVNQPTELTAKL